MKDSKLDLNASVSRDVGDGDTAAQFGPSFPAAASTPFVLGISEVAAHNAIAPLLDPGEITVGMGATIEHLAPSRVGATLTATATVVAREGKRVDFSIEVVEDNAVVARIEHTRAVVDRQRFLERLNR